MATILCVDDEPAVGVVLEHALQQLEHHCILVASVQDAIATLDRQRVDLIISDYRMPEATGLDLLGALKERHLNIPVIMMTGYSSIQHAVIAIRSGAIDYLTKPVRPETLEIAVSQALQVVALRSENDRYRSELSSLRSRREIVGDSAVVRTLLETVTTVAPTRATVLLHGESGTGKELFARAIHDHSLRHDKPFVSLNCAALPEGLVESALFGHEKGAFTGATSRTAGAFERANEGTLLLDEISEMRLDLQSKLLRVIQEHEFERVGGHDTVKVDVRLIATTNRNLQEEVREGRFREDLFYRLNVVPIRTPPLRDHPEDIPLLVRTFLDRVRQTNGVTVRSVSPEAMEVLCRHPWPGNVRQLANAVERAAILSADEVLRPESFADSLGGPHALPSAALPADRDPESDGGTTIPAGLFDLGEIEKIMIERALEATGGNRTRAAKLLCISERTLRNKLNTKRQSTVGSSD